MGEIFPTPPLWAFPLVGVLKTTLVTTVLWGLAIFWGKTRRIPRDPERVLPGILLLLALFFTRTTTFRYALPALALLLPSAARALATLVARQRHPWVGHGVALCFLLAHAASSLAHLDRPISYLNELIPKSKRLLLLGNYNYDVGQDFKRLAQAARARGWTSLKLADTTMIEPCYYGVPWKSWSQKDLEGPQPGQRYVMGASFLQCPETAYPETAPLSRGWPSRVPPTGRIGETLLYWEVGGKQTLDSSPPLHSRPYFKSPRSACDQVPSTP